MRGCADEGVRVAMEHGDIFCMPRLPKGWTVPAGYTQSTCPTCRRNVMRSDAIPDGAKAACTMCARKGRA